MNLKSELLLIIETGESSSNKLIQTDLRCPSWGL